MKHGIKSLEQGIGLAFDLRARRAFSLQFQRHTTVGGVCTVQGCGQVAFELGQRRV